MSYKSICTQGLSCQAHSSSGSPKLWQMGGSQLLHKLLQSSTPTTPRPTPLQRRWGILQKWLHKSFCIELRDSEAPRS